MYALVQVKHLLLLLRCKLVILLYITAVEKIRPLDAKSKQQIFNAARAEIVSSK